MSHYSSSNVRTSPAIATTLDLIRGLVDPATLTAVVDIVELAEQRGISRDTLRLHVNALKKEGSIIIQNGDYHSIRCLLRG